jgi:hypothetical protein
MVLILTRVILQETQKYVIVQLLAFYHHFGSSSKLDSAIFFKDVKSKYFISKSTFQILIFKQGVRWLFV